MKCISLRHDSVSICTALQQAAAHCLCKLLIFTELHCIALYCNAMHQGLLNLMYYTVLFSQQKYQQIGILAPSVCKSLVLRTQLIMISLLNLRWYQYNMCSAVQCSISKCSAVQLNAGLCSAGQYSVVQCRAVQCGRVHCSVVQCSSVQFSAVQCSAVHQNSSAVQWSRVQCVGKPCNLGVGWSSAV